jgi:diguanylate cyclase (GGDEF)-like protein
MTRIDWFIHGDCQAPSDLRYRARILALILFAYTVIATVYSIYIVTSPAFPPHLKNFSLALLLPSGLFYGSLLAWLKLRGRYAAVAHALVASSALPIAISLFYTGGPAQSPATQTLLIPVVIAFCLCGARVGLFWSVSLLTVCYGMMIAAWSGFRYPNLVADTVRDTSIIMNWPLSYVAVIVVVLVYETMNKDLASERDRERDRLAHMANHDLLTGLANRARFEEACREAAARNREREQHLALLYIDLDGFKPINDKLGHMAGDVVLQQVAARLRRCLGNGDFVARVGGDEFAVLIENVKYRDDAERVAEKLRQEIRAPIAWEQVEVRVDASLGVALYPDDGISIDAVVRHADAQMYRNKRDGDRWQVFSDQAAAGERDPPAAA